MSDNIYYLLLFLLIATCTVANHKITTDAKLESERMNLEILKSIQ